MAPKKRKSIADHMLPQAPARLPCPACQKYVPAFFVNSHLDMECSVLRGLGHPEASAPADPGSCGPAESSEMPESGFIQVEKDINHLSVEVEPAGYSTFPCEEEKNCSVERRDGYQDILKAISDPKRSESQSSLGELGHYCQFSENGYTKQLLNPSDLSDDDCRNDYTSEHRSQNKTITLHASSILSAQQTKDFKGTLKRKNPFARLGTAICNSPDIHRSFSLPMTPKIPNGLQVIENFITVEEEEQLLHCLDTDVKNPWKQSRVNGVHSGKSYGNHIFGDQSRRVVTQVNSPMPKFVIPIIKRMRDEVPALKEFFPNEMNSIDYLKSEGHYLKSHMDDRQLSGTILVNLSMGGCCFMTYKRERGLQDAYRIKLLPRSLQIVAGQSRYNYTHGIQKNDLLDPRRVSMTFRKSVETSRTAPTGR